MALAEKRHLPELRNLVVLRSGLVGMRKDAVVTIKYCYATRKQAFRRPEARVDIGYFCSDKRQTERTRFLF